MIIDVRMDILIAKDILQQLDSIQFDLDQGFIEGAIYRLRRLTEWCTNLQNRVIDDVVALETHIHLKEQEK